MIEPSQILVCSGNSREGMMPISSEQRWQCRLSILIKIAVKIAIYELSFGAGYMINSVI